MGAQGDLQIRLNYHCQGGGGVDEDLLLLMGLVERPLPYLNFYLPDAY